MQSIEEKVAELNARKKALQEARDFISTKRAEYEKEIEKPSQFAEREEREINALLGSKVIVNLQTYVEELAKLWDTDVKNLEVNLIFNTFSEKMTFKQLLSECIDSVNPTMTLLVTYKNGASTRGAQIKYPITKEVLKEIQKDGKPFFKHLRPEIIEVDANLDRYDSTLICDDYKNLHFTYTFGYLSKIMNNPDYKTIDNIALLNASIRDNQHNKENIL